MSGDIEVALQLHAEDFDVIKHWGSHVFEGQYLGAVASSLAKLGILPLLREKRLSS